jgi:tRNA A-37 threonylcarbamoyl transferase component Bud32
MVLEFLGFTVSHSLFPSIRRLSKRSFKFAMKIGAKLMSALKKLHGQGIVHGKLAFDNVGIQFGQNHSISVELHNFYFAQPTFLSVLYHYFAIT